MLSPRSRFSIPSVTILAMVLIVVGLAFSSGCEFVDDAPDVISVEVQPSTITQADTTNTGEVFTVIISTENFTDDFAEDLENGELSANAFIQDIQGSERETASSQLEVDGPENNIIRINGIQGTWFGGAEPGDYSIGVEVDSANEFVRARNVAVVVVDS